MKRASGALRVIFYGKSIHATNFGYDVSVRPFYSNFKRKTVCFNSTFSCNGQPLHGAVLTAKPSESWIEEKVTSFIHYLKKEVCESRLISMRHESF